MKVVFWLAALIMAYTWIGYLLFVKLLTWLRKTGNELGHPVWPSVTVLLAVRDEERNIRQRINNLLDADYPEDRLEILVASDNSTDKTDEIVNSIASFENRLKLVKTEMGGKSVVQNRAIPLASGQIVVLTDAETLFAKDTIKTLLRNFTDNEVGCVSGRLVLKDGNSSISKGHGIYWSYEIVLRKLESDASILHTASGAIMAFRKDLFRPFDPKYGDDCIIPLNVISQGYKVIHEDNAVAYDAFPSTIKEELKARTRMTLRNITCTLSKYRLLNPFRFPLISHSILFHRVFRWLTPYFMIILFVNNIFLLHGGSFYQVLLCFQIAFYLFGLLGFIAEKNNLRIPFVNHIFTLVLANIGFFMGVLRALAGGNMIRYPDHRVDESSQE